MWTVYIGVSEWLLFNANSAIFQLYHGQNKLIFNDDEVRFGLDPELDFYSASTLKHSTHYPDPEPTSLCSFILMFRAKRRRNKYQFYSLWLDPNEARTHDLPHSRRACYPLRHQCDCVHWILIVCRSVVSQTKSLYNRFNRVNEWLFLMPNQHLFYLNHGKNKLKQWNNDDDDVCFVLYQNGSLK